AKHDAASIKPILDMIWTSSEVIRRAAGGDPDRTRIAKRLERSQFARSIGHALRDHVSCQRTAFRKAFINRWLKKYPPMARLYLARRVV
ncbi:MAG: hypothetical protein RKO68_04385, partial [Candidatus Accumulibacter sp.]|nr:hypothetical protein [Accumulibacter sp.]